jgi:hypothetical protein
VLVVQVIRSRTGGDVDGHGFAFELPSHQLGPIGLGVDLHVSHSALHDS